MPAFCAAIGSFHAKSWVMYFVRVLTKVRVLPFFLSFTLIRSSTLTVSTFGVRSYTDQRYWSMQTSGSRHASRASELAAGRAAFCPGSVGLTATNSSGGAAGRDIGGGSGKAALPLAISATETPYSPSAVAWDASTCSARAVADVARLTSIGAPALSMPSEPRPASLAAKPARATVPHNAADTASRRGLFTPLPLKFLREAMADFQSSVDDDCKPYRATTSRAARIIPGNSALTAATTAKSSSAMTITIFIFIAQTRAHDEPPTNSLANGRRAPG